MVRRDRLKLIQVSNQCLMCLQTGTWTNRMKISQLLLNLEFKNFMIDKSKMS